jgi:hypothetical protein
VSLRYFDLISNISLPDVCSFRFIYVCIVSISFKEFCDICRREPRTSEEKLMNAFRKLDTNGDGYLTVYELQKVLTSVSWLKLFLYISVKIAAMQQMS